MLNNKRLKLESLEDRRMYAVFVDDIPQITVAEGSVAQLSRATFYDASPGGNYSGTVDWGDGAGSQNASVIGASGNTGNLRIRFDYSFDTSNFFTAERREVLEAAAEIVVGRLGDNLAGFTSAGTNTFTANLFHPSTGDQLTIPNFSVQANEFVVFAGSRDLPPGALAEAGPGGGSANSNFFQVVQARGQFGVPQTDFAPWGGGISFDSRVEWHTDLTSTADLTSASNDMVSVAVHELLHVMGVSSGIDSFDRFIVGGRFTGPATVAAFDQSGAPQLAPDNVHFLEGTTDGGEEASLDPTITRGTRKLPTDLDFALLDDLGWDLLPSFRDGTASASNQFADNGVFNAELTIQNGNEVGRQQFRVVVSNVAPEFGTLPNLTSRANQNLSVSAAFTDPGLNDTFTTIIDWGDGSQQQRPPVSGRNILANHVYQRPGTYTVQIGVQDDDGGQDIQSFQVTVSAPPRGDWQNTQNEFDVNDNDVVSPLDALLIINELSNREFSDPTTGLLPVAPVNVPLFLDVNADDFVGPQDALLVINQLNAGQPAAALSQLASDQPLFEIPDLEDPESARSRPSVIDLVFEAFEELT